MDTLLVLTSPSLRDEILNQLAQGRTVPQIQQLRGTAYEALQHGKLLDADFAAIDAAITCLLKRATSQPTVMQRIPEKALLWKESGLSRFKPHNRRPMPVAKKEEYVKRRRKIANSGYLPAELALHFTTGQLSVLGIIAQEVGKFGKCGLMIEKIAALAGVCHATVRRAVALATKLKILNVQYRPVRGRPSKTNILTIISESWSSWLKRRLGKKPVTKAIQNAVQTTISFFSNPQNRKCYPTPYTINIKGNRLNADYSFTKKTFQDLKFE